jgi:hypothetical protein
MIPPSLLCRSDSIDKLISSLAVTDDERKRLVNTRLDPALMRVVLDFFYSPDNIQSVPPLLMLTPIPDMNDAAAAAQLAVRSCRQLPRRHAHHLGAGFVQHEGCM